MKEKKASFLFFLIFTLISFSCDRFSDKDLSLRPEEYQDMGLPEHTKIWDYNDYTEACVVLSNIKSLKPFSLPKKGSRKSGEIFDRLIDTDNLLFLQDDNLTLNDRAYRIQKYINVQGCFVTAYTDLNDQEQYYNHELIDLYIFGLIIAQDMLDLGNLINESVDEKDIEMQYGYKSIQYMYITMVLYVLENQQKSHFFEEEDLIRLSDFLYDSVLINREWMEDAAAADIKKQVEEIVRKTSSKEINAIYNKLLGIL